MKALPNILSGVRIILALVFVFLYTRPDLFWQTLSIAVFAIAAVTDFFDGYIARHYEAESKSGIFLDPLADKVLTFSGFVCLPFISAHIFPWWGVLLIILRDTTITLLRIFAETQNTEVKTSYSAKVKTAVQMIFLYFSIIGGVFIRAQVDGTPFFQTVMLHPAMHLLFLAVVAITLATGIEYIYANRALFSPKPKQHD